MAPDAPTEPRVMILVIDDDQEDALIVQEFIEMRLRNADFHHADDATKGLQRVRDFTPDVVLVDYQLGKVDGLEVIKEIVATRFLGPIILLTGQDDFELGRSALRVGATDYLLKGSLSADGLERSIRYAMERKELENQLRSLNDELETRVQERTSELEEANRELQSFTYSASHDLRTPLRAIVGTSRIIRDDHGESLTDEGRMLLERQAQAARRLGDLLDDLLDLTRLGKHEIKHAEVDLVPLLVNIAEEVTASMELRLPEKLIVKGDVSLIQLTLQNLIENACKFVKPGDSPRMDVEEVETARGCAVRFRDYGMGFDQKFEPKIWLPFQRLVRDEDFPGTGIGLANVRRIVDRHGGKIWAEGRLNDGADFFLQLPD